MRRVVKQVSGWMVSVGLGAVGVAGLEGCLGNEGTVRGAATAPSGTQTAGDVTDIGNLADSPGSTQATVATTPETTSGEGTVTRPPLIVHEWGTFTSLQDPSGVSQPGLHHEDEPLPGFVYQRDFKGQTYYAEALPEESLQQLETPVVYFYAPEKMDVHFHVDFPQGLVTQWFPSHTTFAPAIGNITAVAGGAMDWQVTVDPSILPSQFPPVRPDEIWAPARNVASTPVTVTPDGVQPLEAWRERTPEYEQFIFYRGIGNFIMPVKVTATDTHLTIREVGPEALAAVFVLNVGKDGGAVQALGPLAGGAALEAEVPAIVAGDGYQAEARRVLKEALIATGLYGDEAQAMVDTWTRSWFGNVGLRVLYIVPRTWTDRLLPVTVTPAPDELVRTLVGRIEVMTPTAMRTSYELLMAGMASTDWSVRSQILDELGRFAEPRIRSVIDAPGFEMSGSPGAGELLQMAHDRW